ncbi:hypothetical protein [Prosthecobacter sp.]|jgi:hypothetical protein|uniref:hypothetical protein n=1 Tax=Prosthecobacter sp. TaxID=1965333 RepID=UPI003785322C
MTTRFIFDGADHFDERARLIAERLAKHERELRASSWITRWLLRRKIIRGVDRELFGRLY